MRKKSDVSACVMTSPGEDEERIFRHRICFCGFPSYITPARVSGRHNLSYPSSTRYETGRCGGACDGSYMEHVRDIQIARLDTGGCGFRPVTVQRP